MAMTWKVTEQGVVTRQRPSHQVRRGIELRPVAGGYLWRTKGAPATVRKILGFDRRAIQRVAGLYDELLLERSLIPILVTIAATETAGQRKRWRREPDGRTSYGIYQFLNVTANGVAGAKVTPGQLYEVAFSTVLAYKDLLRTLTRHQFDPIKACAIWNAGRLRRSTRNPWGYVVHRDHLDRAAAWYGDVCAVL